MRVADLRVYGDSTTLGSASLGLGLGVYGDSTLGSASLGLGLGVYGDSTLGSVQAGGDKVRKENAS